MNALDDRVHEEFDDLEFKRTGDTIREGELFLRPRSRIFVFIEEDTIEIDARKLTLEECHLLTHIRHLLLSTERDLGQFDRRRRLTFKWTESFLPFPLLDLCHAPTNEGSVFKDKHLFVHRHKVQIL